MIERPTPDHDELAALVGRLSLEEKVQLCTGRDLWSTWPAKSVGLRSMVLSDGPSGVRGPIADERSPSLSLPSATALAASWDVDIARRYGAVAAVEARRKGVDVVLGPTVNLHRSPLGGRHFECFSEDPVLTAVLAAAYVDGVQDNGVGATLKHYVANDFETERLTADVQATDRTLRELYLLAFERAVTEARAWAVMSAYNSVNGTTSSENDLLETPLNSEWGFDGVVVSDWGGTRSLAAAHASQDLAMPGPDGPWGQALVDAVRAGDVPEAAVDRKVARILVLAARVGALDGYPAAEPVATEHGLAFAREAAADGTVLLENRGELPWSSDQLRSVAVIGHNAAVARTQGGGSAMVLPEHSISPLAGLRAALPGAQVTFSLGAVVQDGLVELPRTALTLPGTDAPGASTRFLRGHREVFSEHRLASKLIYLGTEAPIEAGTSLELTTTYTPTSTERTRLGFGLVGRGSLFVNGVLHVQADLSPEHIDIGAVLLTPPTITAEIDLVAGTPVDLRLVYDLDVVAAFGANAMGLVVGTEPIPVDEDELIARAARAAADAEVALVVVGTNSVVETEGYDRTSLALPGRQDDLVRAVAAANPHTVVLVNAGAPVLMPWREEVAALLIGWFGGQEFGHAIGDVLLGTVEPGGRLPTTWPAAEADAPVLSCTPDRGVLTYAEGVHIGYRAWLRQDTAPAYWFGAGQGYTVVELTTVQAPDTARAGNTVTVTVGLTNRGDRAGKQVVQVYAERPGSAVDRPLRWLVGSAVARLPAGSSTTVDVAVPTRHLADWRDGWVYEPGSYRLLIGTSAVDLPLSTELRVDL